MEYFLAFMIMASTVLLVCEILSARRIRYLESLVKMKEEDINFIASMKDDVIVFLTKTSSDTRKCLEAKTKEALFFRTQNEQLKEILIKKWSNKNETNV